MKLVLRFEDMIETDGLNIGGSVYHRDIGDIDELTIDELMELVREELEKAVGVYESTM